MPLRTAPLTLVFCTFLSNVFIKYLLKLAMEVSTWRISFWLNFFENVPLFWLQLYTASSTNGRHFFALFQLVVFYSNVRSFLFSQFLLAKLVKIYISDHFHYFYLFLATRNLDAMFWFLSASALGRARSAVCLRTSSNSI